MIDDAPFDWLRAPRVDYDLGVSTGVYALFLIDGSQLPGIVPPERGLIYVGKAGGAGGLLQRCHFRGSTRNHSPRKSLAVLLMDELRLRPIRVDKPNRPHTWCLDRASEIRLTEWMLTNLHLAIEPRASPDAWETEIVARLAPAFNLAKCLQTEQHRRISAARKRVWSAMASDDVSHPEGGSARVRHRPSQSTIRPSVRQSRSTETADAMAARYGLIGKSFRSALRREIPWYKKPQVWEFPVGSDQHRDMEEIARHMRRLPVASSVGP